MVFSTGSNCGKRLNSLRSRTMSSNSMWKLWSITWNSTTELVEKPDDVVEFHVEALVYHSSVRPVGRPAASHLQNHRHDQRPTGRLFHDIPLQIRADLLLDHAPVGLLLAVGGFQRFRHHLAGALHEVRSVFGQRKAAADDFRQALHASGVPVDGDDGQHDAVFGKMPAVADHHLLHDVVHRAGIDAHASHGHLAGTARAVVVDLQHVAGFHDEGIFQARGAQMLGQACVLGELPELAVDRHEVPRPHQVQDQLHFFHAGVPGNVHRWIHAAVQHVGPAARHVVDHAEDALLVARDDARAQHHRVAFFHRDVLVVIHGHARKRRHGLALRARNEHGDLFRGGAHDVLRTDQDSVGNLEQPEGVGNLADGCHTPSDNRHFPAELRRKIQHQLNSVDGRTETRDHQTSLGAVEDVFHARLDGALGFGVARPVGIGRVGKEQQDAPLAVVGQGVQVEELVVGGGGIDLEIAGVDDDSQRRGDGQRDGADDGVRYMDKLDLEWTYRQYLLRLDWIQLGFFFKLVFFQPPLYQSQREGCSVHWHADLGQEIGHRSDVVLMAVGQDQSFDLRLVLLQEGEIGHDQVHAQQFVFREHHPGVDHDDFITETDGGHVHAELAQSAQGDYL